MLAALWVFVKHNSNEKKTKKQADRQVQFAAIVFFFLHVLMQQFREDTVQIRFCFSG